MNSQSEQRRNLHTTGEPRVSDSIRIRSSGSLLIGGDRSDLTLISSDQAFYHVHRTRILRASNNSFADLVIDGNTRLNLAERASVLDLLVNIIYGKSCTHLAPSLETIDAALDALVKYGIPPRLNAFPGGPLYQLLLLHAPRRAIDAYALAGYHRLEDAAISISEHLLAYDTSQLSDGLVTKMGPVYFRRLLCMHQNRLSALKRIVLRPAAQHPPTPTCGTDAPARARLGEAWGFAVAQLVWDVSPGITTDTLRGAFEGVEASSTYCSACRAALQTRVAEVCEAWAAVKVRASVPAVTSASSG